MLNKVVLPPVQLVSACGGQFALYSRRSPTKESSNEDVAAVVAISAESGAVLVADGLGGMRTGEVASSIAVSSVCEMIQQLPSADGRLPPVIVSEDDPVLGRLTEFGMESSDRIRRPGSNGRPDSPDMRIAILNGLEHANERILTEATGSATTIAVVEIRNREIRTYHVGDSMVVVCGLKGKLKFQTVCHSPVGFAVKLE